MLGRKKVMSSRIYLSLGRRALEEGLQWARLREMRATTGYNRAQISHTSANFRKQIYTIPIH